MEYKHFDHYLVVRLDKGDEVVGSIGKICQQEEITLAAVSGIGAIHRATIGLFDTRTKVYETITREGEMEITCLMGNVSRKDGQVYLHLHATLSDISYAAFGGHLNEAVISGTGEVIIHIIQGKVERSFSDKDGLNLLDFKK